MNDVAIVILNYNGAYYLTKFLPSVIEYSGGCRIIVADNCSTDNSLDILKKQFPQVETLIFHENHGYSQGYNHALQQVDSPYLILLNSDVEVTEGWWQSSIQLLKSSEEIAAVQPKILSFHNKEMFEYAGAGGGFIDNLGYPFCRGRVFLSLEHDNGQYDDVTQVFWASGACLFIRASSFNTVKGFDAEFFAHMEEIDLCWRLQRIGYKIMYNGKSHVYHVGGGTLEKSHPKKTYLNFRNGLALLYKNYSAPKLYSLLPIRIILDWIAALKFTLSENPQHGMAVIKAHLHFFRDFPNHSKKRTLLKNTSSGIPNTIYQKSIVVEYFLKRKKKFGELSAINKLNNTTTS